MTGETKPRVVLDGMIRNAPIAKVNVNTPYFLSSTCHAVCMPNPVYDVIIGNIENARDPKDPCLDWRSSDSEKNTGSHDYTI